MQAQYHCLRFIVCLRVIVYFRVIVCLLFSSRVFGQAVDPIGSQLFSPERVNSLVLQANQSGDFQRGLRVYVQAKSACFSCHRVLDAGGVIGPELTRICKERTPAQLAESLLWPNQLIAKEYQSLKIATIDGESFSGYVSESESTSDTLVLIDPATRKTTAILRSEIESQAKGLSLMPDGLVDSLTAGAQADLLSFLVGLGTRTDLDLPAIEAAVRTASTHEPATFPYVRDPIHPELRTAWKNPVNRDRVYDFYTKQADYFSKQAKRPEWLAGFPGLDGPGFGHWGNQNEESWKGDEWNDVVHGLVQCQVLQVQPKPIARAVCFKMGAARAWSACFNPETFAYERLWTGGFLKFSSVRHGLIDGARIAGNEFKPPLEAQSVRQLLPQLANATIEYHGYYVHQDNILFSYSADGVEYIDAPTIVKGAFKRIVAPKLTHPLRQLLSGGPTQWPFTIETEIRLGQGKGFAIDSIELPKKNPWKIPIACGDHAFLKDGTGIVSTMHGDVWRVTGIKSDNAIQKSASNSSGKARWRRIASGLHQALGVWVHDEQIYVLGRNQITRLHDFNGDLETDWYECFSNAFVTSPGGHDYICALQRDPEGNFYIASGNQGIVQISADGKTSKVIATGFRNPDGLGLLPDGTLTVPSSEGEWTATSMISQVLPKKSDSGGSGSRVEWETAPVPFYGYRGPREGQSVELPLVYLPRGIDNSSGGQAWIGDSRMGPLKDTLIHTSFGAGTAFAVLRDRVAERWQGAVVPLPGEYRAGVHRAHTNPADGQLYLSGMYGWGTYTSEEGCFQRLRYTGEEIQFPTGFHVHRNGVAIHFRQAIDAKVASDTSAHFVQCWNYRYSPGYGSKEFSVLHPPMIGHDCLAVESAHVLEDGKTLFLEIPDLQLCNQLHLRVQTNERMEPQELFATVHAMDKDRVDIPGYREQTGKVVLPHPMARDLEWLQRSVPNPWRTRIPLARMVRIESRENLQFSTRTLEATSGEILKLTFGNPDVVPHNWALLRPGSLERVGELANRMVNDPEAYLRHYVPESKDVICYTDVVDPSGESEIYFAVPKEPGRYPFLCTFPGHWMVMNGEMIVTEKAGNPK